MVLDIGQSVVVRPGRNVVCSGRDVVGAGCIVICLGRTVVSPGRTVMVRVSPKGWRRFANARSTTPAVLIVDN